MPNTIKEYFTLILLGLKGHLVGRMFLIDHLPEEELGLGVPVVVGDDDPEDNYIYFIQYDQSLVFSGFLEEYITTN